MLPYSDQNWRDLFTLMGTPELSADDRFRTRPDRVTNANELYAMLNELTPAGPQPSGWTIANRTRFRPRPSPTWPELRDDPYFTQVGMLRDEVHPTEGPYKVVRDAIRSHHSLPGLNRHAPKLGQHTEEIRAELRD